ncbi:MAG: peptidoglycan bridge formation glycyltransferase FemA/FemB family protein [Bacilli bacterium]|nr:peptidoglycan bridge formation glycyltransferase FemA/FemB family protein [Bacilli bacterium]
MIIELGRREFDEFAFNHPYRSFYQTSQYGTLMSKHGYRPMYIGYDDGDGLCAAALILTKKQFGMTMGYSPRGYLIDFNDYRLVDDFTARLKEYLQKKGIVYLIIDPHITHLERDKDGNPIEKKQTGVNISDSLKRIGYEHRGFNLYFENLKPRWNMVLKTDSTPINIFNNFEKHTRTKIRNSLRKGVEVYKGSKQDLKLFYQLTNKKHYRKYDYYLDMYEIFSQFDMFDIYFARINTETFLKNSKLLFEHETGKNNELTELLQKNIRDEEERNKLLNRKLESDKLLNTYRNDIIFGTKLYKDARYVIIAANAIIKYGNEVFFLIDGVNQKFKRFNPNHLLKWKIIEEYRNLGYTKFHLNGITGDFTNKNKFLGLYTFKKGFDTRITEYIGEFSLIVNKPKYRLLKSFKPFINSNLRKD